MAYENITNIKVAGAKIKFKNFEGRVTEYNKNGIREFSLVLDEEDALNLQEIGWKVKPKELRDGSIQYLLPVEASFKKVPNIKPMKVMQVTRKNQLLLDEETIGNLDYADILNIDLTIRPYCWGPVQGKTGIKAFLQEMWVTIDEDDWADKYATDESNQEPMPFDN